MNFALLSSYTYFTLIHIVRFSLGEFSLCLLFVVLSVPLSRYYCSYTFVFSYYNYIYICIYSGQQRGTVRLLRNGIPGSFSSGRVQVYINNRWGNICDDESFDLTEATVICHQLGYSEAISQSQSSIDMYLK